VAATFGKELPGEDVLGLPSDVLLSVAVVGRCVAGLAEAINVRILHESRPEALTHVGSLTGSISALGQLTAAVDDAHAVSGVPLPRALVLVLGVIRNLNVAATIMDGADRAPGQLPSDGRAGAEQLAKAFCGDATCCAS
jgi:hypothetical protein